MECESYFTVMAARINGKRRVSNRKVSRSLCYRNGTNSGGVQSVKRIQVNMVYMENDWFY